MAHLLYLYSNVPLHHDHTQELASVTRKSRLLGTSTTHPTQEEIYCCTGSQSYCFMYVHTFISYIPWVWTILVGNSRTGVRDSSIHTHRRFNPQQPRTHPLLLRYCRRPYVPRSTTLLTINKTTIGPHLKTSLPPNCAYVTEIW